MKVKECVQLLGARKICQSHAQQFCNLSHMVVMALLLVVRVLVKLLKLMSFVVGIIIIVHKLVNHRVIRSFLSMLVLLQLHMLMTALHSCTNARLRVN